jgi:sensor domain CHASE-containing protein
MSIRKRSSLYLLSLMAMLAAGLIAGNAYAGRNRQDAERAYNKMHQTKEQLRAAKDDLKRIHSSNANWTNTQTNAIAQIEQAFQTLDAADAQIKAGIQGIND